MNDQTYHDNAEVGAAALRRIDALEAALRNLLGADEGDIRELMAREAAERVLKADWMPAPYQPFDSITPAEMDARPDIFASPELRDAAKVGAEVSRAILHKLAN